VTPNVPAPTGIKARGVKLGRKPKLTEHQKREAIRRRDREPVREIARSDNVSDSTISALTVLLRPTGRVSRDVALL
jgi:hypothetical protein